MNKITTIIIISVIIIGGFLYVSSKKKPQSMNTTGQSQLNVTEQIPAPSAPTNTKMFTIEGGNFTFTPNLITVSQGDTVKITFKNLEGFHDLVLDEFQIQTKQIAAGQEETVQFVADKVGSFEFYCSVGSHRKMGMVGTLEVK